MHDSLQHVLQGRQYGQGSGLKLTAAISHVALTTHSLCSALHLTDKSKKPEKTTVKASAKTFRIRAVTMTLNPFSS